MTRNLELLKPARQEIREAFEWYLARSPRAAEGFLREVDRGLLFVAESPELWLKYEAGTRRYRLRKYPYNIVYREEGPRVVVVAVAHQKREPGYWRSREQ